MKKRKMTAVLLASTLALGSFTQVASAVNVMEMNEMQETTERKSFDFNAIDKNFVELASPLSEIPDTIEMWVKLDKNINKRQILLGNYVVNKNCFSLELTLDNQLRYVEYGYEGANLVSSIDLKTTNKAICTEEWSHLAVQRDIENQTIRLLQDGEIILEKKLDGVGKNKILDVVPMPSNHFIGTDARKSMFLNGEIASMRLWDIYKTTDEIKTDMNKDIVGDETGLAHAWMFDDDTLSYANNIVEDIVENGIHGTATNFDLSGNTIYNKDGTDFTDGSASAELGSDLAMAPLTFEAWVNIPKAKVGERGVIIGNYFNSYYTDIPLVNFELTANGEPRLYWKVDGTAYDYVAKGMNVYTGKWTHVAISYDALQKKMTCYINGEAVNETAIDFVPQKLNQSLKIGGDSRPTMSLKGSMADLRVWSSTRTAEEIEATYNQEVAEDTEGLLGYWKLNDKNDNQFTDYSTYANNAVDNWISDDLFAKKEDGYHSIVVLPDTQTLTANRPESYTKLTNWIKNSADKFGIELAIHVGDIVNSNGSQAQWNNAVASMSVLDGEVPYVFSPGNHDSAFSMVDGASKRDSAMFNKNFPYAKYAANDTFGGAFETGKMDNTYSFFDIGGVSFMTISLETSPRDDVLAWAGALIEKHADKKVIISTHNYLHLDGKRTTEQTQDHHAFYDNTGDEMWNQMIKNYENVVMVVSGHIGYPDVVMTEDVGIHGNVVKQVLCDAQFADQENISTQKGDGLGMVMLLSFKEGSDDVQVNWYSTVREQFYRQRNQFTTSMQLTNDVSFVKEILSKAIAKVDNISEDDMQKLAPKVQFMITEAYAAAVSVMKNDAATIEQCLEAWMNLANALHYADFKADKTELDVLINICKDLKEEDYIGGFEAMIVALETAQNVLDDENALQTRIDKAYRDLLNAYNALIKTEDTIKGELAKLVAIFDELDGSKYCNNEAWQMFVKELDNSKAVLGNDEATVHQIHAAFIALTNAYEDIRLLPDEDVLAQLQAFLDKVESLDLSKYSKEQITRFMAITSKVSTMINDVNTYDPAILEEMALLNEVIDNGQIIISEDPVQPEDEITQVAATPSEVSGVGTSNAGITKTGDTTNLAGIIGMLLASGAGLYMIRKKREMKK